MVISSSCNKNSKICGQKIQTKENLYVILQAEEITSQVESHRYRKESLMLLRNVEQL